VTQASAPLNNPRIVLAYFDSANPDLLRIEPPAYYGPDGAILGQPIYDRTDALAIECLVMDVKYLLERSGDMVTHESFLEALLRSATEPKSAFPQLNLELRIKRPSEPQPASN
jgi:hypothetical protein